MKRSLKNNKIRVLFYEPSSGFGGSASGLANLINHLNREVFCPIVIIKNYGPQIERIKNAQILKTKAYEEPDKISKLKFFLYFLKNIAPETIRIYFIIKRNNIALVHANTSIISGTAALLAAKLANTPIIFHIKETRGLIRREVFLAKFVERFIFSNKQACELYRKYVDEDKLTILYDGIGLNEFTQVERSGLRQEYNLDSSALVGIVGRVVEGKGHKEFILAAKEVLKVKPKVTFLIVGGAKGDNDSCYKEASGLVKKENLDRNIIFTGWRRDVKNVISELDILIQATTTYPEGLPNIIIEAMALSKPVIATNIPGSSEIVIDGKTGFLVPPGNQKKLAEAILSLLNNKNLAKNFAEAGRLRAEELFNITNIVSKVETVYIELLNKTMSYKQGDK